MDRKIHVPRGQRRQLLNKNRGSASFSNCGENNRFKPPHVENDHLGEGNFSSVYRIRDARGNEFALKKLSKLKKHTFDSAMKEIAILSKLRHSNIVEYISSFKTSTEVCIVMELMAGSVKSIMMKNGGRLGESQAKSIIQDALKGLIYLHSNGIIHRDVRCDNILLDKYWNAKLADMGIANFLECEGVDYSDSTDHKATGLLQWQAPEVRNGKKGGKRADVWMVGITALEIVEGSPPHDYQIRKPRDYQKLVDGYQRMSDGLKDFLKKIFVILDDRPYAPAVAAHAWLKFGLLDYYWWYSYDTCSIL